MKRLVRRLLGPIALGVGIRLIVDKLGLEIPETIFALKGMHLNRAIVHGLARTVWFREWHTNLEYLLTQCSKALEYSAEP